MENKLFLVSISAQERVAHGIHIQHKPFLIWANSKEEAEGQSVRLMKVSNPIEQGWSSHSATASEIAMSDCRVLLQDLFLFVFDRAPEDAGKTKANRKLREVWTGR